jgi:hypothetical protein
MEKIKNKIKSASYQSSTEKEIKLQKQQSVTLQNRKPP